ncbi:AI-2E family transporter [Thioalkalicoccus limnaeus]|uniref:AI-2E family transporter n=1 Tax=Thioalkalicoccus limnaeus TaxID=120681 RepID=A0ABV4BDK8_9GAMM
MRLLNSSPNAPYSTLFHWLFAAAALVIVLGGLKAISHIVTPFLLAGFLAIICAPPLGWMQRRGVPGPLSVLLLFSVVGLTFFLLFLALKGAAESLASQAPVYQARLSGWFVELEAWAKTRGLPEEMLPTELPWPATATITWLAREIATGLGQFTASTLLVLLAFMFLLLEERTLSDKLSAAFPNRRRARVRARRFLRSVLRYLLIKTAASVATGLLVGIGLAAIGVDFAVLWGIVAGLLNFIPTIGSIIATVPAFAIALLGLGLTEAALVLALFVVVNQAIGSIIEPRLMGRSLGLSPVVVLVSLLLWGYVFGPVGMLLSIPLTMIAKIALDSSPETRWAGILLSDTAKRR